MFLQYYEDDGKVGTIFIDRENFEFENWNRTTDLFPPNLRKISIIDTLISKFKNAQVWHGLDHMQILEENVEVSSRGSLWTVSIFQVDQVVTFC